MWVFIQILITLRVKQYKTTYQQKEYLLQMHKLGVWTGCVCPLYSVGLCKDPTIGSYNKYHLSPNGIPRGNRRWYGLVYFVYKNAGSHRK